MSASSTDITAVGGERAPVASADGAREVRRRPAIVVREVSKSFRIPVHKRTTLKERALHPFARIPSRELHAARDLSFSVDEGEFFGIVGRNGSGKSTLLKLLTGIYRPDSGDIRINGRVSPLIELGVGFTMEMAARDNVIVNGTLLGLSRSEAQERFDEILEFAGLEQFSELALKNYSSGMLMRLAFSIAIHVDGDVLLLDEVLAVGDGGFQDKCNEAFRRLKKEGKTIILVTHAMDAVRRFCDRAMLLEEGRVITIGKPDDIAELYQDTVADESGAEPEADPHGPRYGDRAADIGAVWVEGDKGERGRIFTQGGYLTICADIRFNEHLNQPGFFFILRSEDGRNVFTASTNRREVRNLSMAPGDRLLVRLRFENHLGVGTYEITPCVGHPDKRQWADARLDFAAFSVRGDGWKGALVELPHGFTIERRGS